MNKKEKELKEKINNLSDFTSEFIQSSERILVAGNQKIFVLDLFSNAVNNRSISTINGFLSLIKENNYLCAIPLIRMQLDNGLRFFASTLVEDSNDFFNHYLSGKAIRNYKDINGNKLTDFHLSKELEKYFPGVRNLYKETSGYIHLSDNHLFATTSIDENIKDRKIEVRVGNYDVYSIESKIDFVSTMIEVCKMVLIIVEQWKHEKIRLSNIYEKNK
ncbi:MAG: hypothetical protein DHS20C13_29340 [Thermodesulfobacteriota bacterium]|nr:MAG: hypothetical protein DHS20C13_29340 [Thermodesulfobacteriota bacterium]